MSDLEISSGELDECPYCGGTIINAQEADFDCGGRRVDCESCGRHWTEGFVVTTIFIPQEWQGIYLERKYARDHCTCATKPNEFCPVHSPELNH